MAFADGFLQICYRGKSVFLSSVLTVERPTMGNEKEDGVFARKLQSVVIRGRMRVLLLGLGRKNNITQH